MEGDEKEAIVAALEAEHFAQETTETQEIVLADLVNSVEKEYAVGYTGDRNARGGKEGHGREVYEDGVYDGFFRNNRRHGEGTYRNTSGDKYEGPWKASCMHGADCKYRFGDGSIYEGEMQFDKFSSFTAKPSILKHASGSVYTGRFRDGMKQGYGKMEYANGDSYEGYWVKDKHHTAIIKEPKEFRVLATPAQLKEKEVKNKEKKVSESGKKKPEDKEKKTKTKPKKYSWSNRSVEVTTSPIEVKPIIEEEERDSGLRSWTYVEGNYGIYTWKDDGNYIGGFKDDQMYGYGIRTWASGVRYRGYFENDVPHGEGIIELPNGESHKGLFRFGEEISCSNVVHRYPTESGMVTQLYEGEWSCCDESAHGVKHSEPHGKGIMVYSDKSAYKGEFNYGLREGFGTQLYPDQSSYYGHWTSDTQDGNGIFIYGDRSGVYDGMWKDNKKHGFGTFTYGDNPRLDVDRRAGDVFEGMFENDLKEGPGRVKDCDGNVLEALMGIYSKDKIVKKEAVEFPTDPEVAHHKILELLAEENEMNPTTREQNRSQVVVWRKDMDPDNPEIIDLSFQKEQINAGDIVEVYDFNTNSLIESYTWKTSPHAHKPEKKNHQ